MHNKISQQLFSFIKLYLACFVFVFLVIDYCSIGNHSCDHECVSMLNGFHCRCHEGYTLDGDGKTCHGMYTVEVYIFKMFIRWNTI